MATFIHSSTLAPGSDAQPIASDTLARYRLLEELQRRGIEPVVTETIAVPGISDEVWRELQEVVCGTTREQVGASAEDLLG